MPVPVYILREGAQGQMVRRVQALVRTPMDSVYGHATARAVMGWQADHGCACDGVCGPQTLAAMGLPVHLGVDVSHYQGEIDWYAVAGAGVAWAACKVSQSRTYRDPTGPANLAGALAAGLSPLAYHYGTPSGDPADAVAEARHALACCEGRPLVLDLEEPTSLPPERLRAWAERWVAEVAEACGGLLPWVYTGSDYIRRALDGGGGLAGCPLWIARYRGADHRDPGPVGDWPEWRVWQWTCKGRLPGIGGNCDLNWVIGDRND